MRKKIEIYKIIKLTAGGFHSWVESNVGRIKKPNSSIGEFSVPGAFKKEVIKSAEKKEILKKALDVPVQLKWYQKIWRFLKRWGGRVISSVS